jgi:serine protease AprX
MSAKSTTGYAMRVILIVVLILELACLSSSSASLSNGWLNVIVQGTDITTLVNVIERNGGEVTSSLAIIHGVGAKIPKASIQKILTDPAVSRVFPNASVKLADSNRVPEIPETDYPQVVGAEVAWSQRVIGNGITVAVVDTGFTRHPGLINPVHRQRQDRIAGWVDFVDGKHYPVDPNGHGTHIAGIIANTQVGPDGDWNGIAPGVRLAGVRVLDENGYGTYEQVIQGIQWVIKNKNKLKIRVMNLSLVAHVQSPYWADPLNQAVMQAWSEGITVVTAAGNGGPGSMSVGVPGNNPYVITVGAFTDNYTPNDWSDDFIAPFSAAGPTLDGFIKPDIVAPGAHMISSMPPNGVIARSHEANRVARTYFSMAGTSQAAGVVSGIAALILSHQPKLTPDQVKYRVLVTAFPWVNLDTDEAIYSMFQQGAGRVNAPDAVFADVTDSANYNLDISADISSDIHYEGHAYFDETTGEFKLRGDFSDWTGGYGAWAGDYGPWTGGYGAWAGGYGAWAGGYGAWAGGYGLGGRIWAWAGDYGAWAGGYGAWAGGYGAWAGGYGAWARRIWCLGRILWGCRICREFTNWLESMAAGLALTHGQAIGLNLRIKRVPTPTISSLDSFNKALGINTGVHFLARDIHPEINLPYFTESFLSSSPVQVGARLIVNRTCFPHVVISFIPLSNCYLQ